MVSLFPVRVTPPIVFPGHQILSRCQAAVPATVSPLAATGPSPVVQQLCLAGWEAAHPGRPGAAACAYGTWPPLATFAQPATIIHPLFFSISVGTVASPSCSGWRIWLRVFANTL